MKHPFFAILLTLSLISITGLSAADRADFYPFDVKVDGQLATANKADVPFAQIAMPVSADAELEIPGVTGMIIVNIFPSKPDGTVPDEAQAQPKIIVIQDGGKAKLTATMDQSRLTPGLYGANIVADGKTARVQFTVK